MSKPPGTRVYQLPKRWFKYPHRTNWLLESPRARHIREQSEARFGLRPDGAPVLYIRGEVGTFQGFTFIRTEP